MKEKGMVLKDFLSMVQRDDSDLYEIIPISLNRMWILKEWYHNTHIIETDKYGLQTG